jgi:YaiO family outer membrane protein
LALLVLALAGLACARLAHGQDDSADYDDRYQDARALALGGQREAAVAAYTALLERSPGNVDVLLGRGRVHAWMGHWAEAEADLLAATQGSPRYADAWSALGDVYLWSDRPLQAVEAYGQWVALAEATDPAALIARGLAYRAAGNRDAARKDFEAAAVRGAPGETIAAYLRSLDPREAVAGVGPPEAVLADGLPWSASLGLDLTRFPAGGLDWAEATASLRYRGAKGSLGLEALTIERFGRKDQAFALDGYRDLWNRAYVNLRFQHAPSAELFPQHRWRAELFQGFGQGWEASAGYDRLGFAEPVELLTVGLGLYRGNWYLRWRHLHVPGRPDDPASSDSERLLARYYYAGDADSYVEVNVGAGSTEPPSTTAPFSREARHSWSTGASWVHFLSPRLGLRLGVNQGYGFESQPFRHRSVAASLYTRW